MNSPKKLTPEQKVLIYEFAKAAVAAGQGQRQCVVQAMKHGIVLMFRIEEVEEMLGMKLHAKWQMVDVIVNGLFPEFEALTPPGVHPWFPFDEDGREARLNLLNELQSEFKEKTTVSVHEARNLLCPITHLIYLIDNTPHHLPALAIEGAKISVNRLAARNVYEL